MNRTGKVAFYLIVVALILEFILLQDLPFFWDGVSKAYRAHWIYTHDFSSLIVPTEYNSGHPPLWITSIAVFWALFGKTVSSARLLLLLVNLGAFYQLYHLCRKSFAPGVSLLFFLLVAIDPTLMAQTTILNNDMLLLFFLLLALNSLWAHKWGWYNLAITGLLLTNLRGIYCTVALVLIHIAFVRFTAFEFRRKMLWAYGIGVGLFVGFLVAQYHELGWVLISKNENYAAHREAAGFGRIAKNAAAYIKNVLDFGRIFLWVPLVLLLVRHFRNKLTDLTVASQRTLIALTIFLLVFFLGFVPFSNPMGPRYLMICFVLAAILFVNLIQINSIGRKLKNGLVALIVMAFLSGHFWIYPATISQGWDSSLAYLNYFPVEQQMLDYLAENQIPVEQVGTHLPINSKHMATVGAVAKLNPGFARPNLEGNRYFLFSNVENRTKDEGIEQLKTQWKEVVSFSQLGVFITLYEFPDR